MRIRQGFIQVVFLRASAGISVAWGHLRDLDALCFLRPSSGLCWILHPLKCCQQRWFDRAQCLLVVSASARAGLQQLLPQSWAVLHCPAQSFIFVTVGGTGMGDAIKEIPASHLNLVKLFWGSDPRELLICSQKEISFCLLKPPLSQGR